MSERKAEVTEEHRKLANDVYAAVSRYECGAATNMQSDEGAQLLANREREVSERGTRETLEELARRYKEKGYREPAILTDFLAELAAEECIGP